MASSHLILHAGSSAVTLDELRECKVPEPEGRWYPVAHSAVLDRVTEALGCAGYEVRSQRLALSHDGSQFFGTLDLSTKLVFGVSLAVGIRNSTNKTLALGFCAGSRVEVCDNLAFRSELLVKRKHAINGAMAFSDAIAGAISKLGDFKEMEAVRIKKMMATELSPEMADSLILRSFENKIISAPQLPRILNEWRGSSFEEFRPRTVWSLLNAYTTVLASRATTQPAKFAAKTMFLSAFLEPPMSAIEEVYSTDVEAICATAV